MPSTRKVATLPLPCKYHTNGVTELALVVSLTPSQDIRITLPVVLAAVDFANHFAILAPWLLPLWSWLCHSTRKTLSDS